MFCKNCGAEIHEGQKFCKACGNKIILTSKVVDNANESMEDMAIKINPSEEEIARETEAPCIDLPEKSNYLFFQNISKRAFIIKVLSGIEKVGTFFLGLLLCYFIYKNIDLAEGYVISVYIMRFLITFVPIVVPLELVITFKELLSYTEEDLKDIKSKTALLGCKIAFMVVCLIIALPFIFASEMTKAGWAMQLSFGGASALISEFMLQIVAFFVGLGLNIYVSKITVDDGEDKN